MFIKPIAIILILIVIAITFIKITFSFGGGTSHRTSHTTITRTINGKTTVTESHTDEYSDGNYSRTRIGVGGKTAVVIYKKFGCDYFILENASGYIVAEWMGGNDPSEGDRYTGDFNSWGSKSYYNQTRGSESRLWIDDYMLSRDDAMEKIEDKCH